MACLAESLVEERVMQLQDISRRRNELLREMYFLVQKRDNLGSLVMMEEEEQSTDDGLRSFLDRFDLEKHSDTGTILNLLEDEVALPETPPAYSPVGVPQRELTPGTTDATKVISESPMSDPPASPLVPERQEEEEEEGERESPIPDLLVPKVEEVPMAVDLSPPIIAIEEPIVADPISNTNQNPHELPEVPATEPRSPSSAAASRHLTPAALPENLPTSMSERLVTATPPYIPLSRQSSKPRMTPQLIAATPEPSASGTPRAHSEADDIKVEPLDDQDMRLGLMETNSDSPVKSQSPEERTVTPFQTVTPAQLTKKLSEDPIVSILGSTLPRSPTPTDEPIVYTVNDYAIPLPSPELSELFSFNGGEDKPISVDHDKGPHQFPPDPPYPLPPLSLLPQEFRWKKQSKRKHKGVDKDSKPHEWQPMGFNKWAAVLKTNPVHTKLQRASKCLSTRDWSIGISEMHLLRVFDRMDQLKNDAQWSFRQPKKQRGVGGTLKTHWDYLMDEMRWMRTDFREERRWKLALAFTLAQAVMEWHEAGCLEERVRRGIVVLWKPPPPEDVEMADEIEGVDDVVRPFHETRDVDENSGDSGETVTPNDGYGSDEESDEELDKEPTNDSLDPSQALQDALEQLEQEPVQSDVITFKPKTEEIEGMMTQGSSGGDPKSMDTDDKTLEVRADESQAQETPTLPKSDVPEDHSGLKASSKNPILGHGKEGPRSRIKYDAIRDPILYSDLQKLFIDLDDLDLSNKMSTLTTNDPPLPPPPHDISQIFSDLDLYTMLNIAPSAPTGQDGRKKSDRRIDKDDPNKRIDEAMYTKLTPTSKFMFVKPTLLGSLRPANNFKDGKWSHIEESPVFVDLDIPPTKPVEDSLCGLFEGAATKTSTPSSHPGLIPAPPRDVRKRNIEQGDSPSWTASDDALLKQAVERYSNNWYLIADAFNSSRVTISTDKRTAFECWERWREKLSNAARADAAEDNTSSLASVSASAHMTTRGLKRSAAHSSNTSASGSTGSAAQSEPRKRRRHAAIYDTLKRTAKRREQAQKSNAAPRAKTTAVHDTHGQFTKLPKLTPAELSRMKAEKEASIAQEIHMRRRNDELARQHLLREQSQRAQAQVLPPNAQQPQAPQGQMLPPGTPNGIQRSQNGIPQVQAIRSSQVGISQQQRIAALANANARMSPSQLAAQSVQMRPMAAGGQGQPPGQAPTPSPSAAQAPHSNASAALTAAAPALSAAHLSPSFSARATSSSPGAPHRSPPLPAASPANTNVPRPPSVPGQPVQGMQVNPMLQVPNLHYYMQNRLTAEQIQVLIAQRSQQQYHAHQHQQQQQPPNGSFPHQ